MQKLTKKGTYYTFSIVLAIPAILAIYIFISTVNSTDQGGLFGLFVVFVAFIASFVFGGASLIFLGLAIVGGNQSVGSLPSENNQMYRPVKSSILISAGLIIISLSLIGSFFGSSSSVLSGFQLIGYPVGGIILVIGVVNILAKFLKNLLKR